MMLCETCADSRGIIVGKGGFELNIDDLIGAGLDAASPPDRPTICSSCGLELGTLRREGRLGCSECADAFYDDIVKSIGYKAGNGTGIDRETNSPGPSAPSFSSRDDEASRLSRELESALRTEDYEGAARLRDELSRLGGSVGWADTSSNSDFPFDPYSFSGASGPDDDVVLGSSARIYRDIVGLPFPGSPHGPSAPSRAILLERLLSYGQWRDRTMSELGPVGRRSLSERGIASRGYTSDDDAVVVSNASLRTYALFDEGDHLRIRTIAPGLDAGAALATALALADRLGHDFTFARRPGIGWICTRLADCGLGCSLSATVHIPALAAVGMRDRLFRTLLSEGLAVRGFYSSSEESAGSVYEIGSESSTAESLRKLVASFSTAVAKVATAERRARSEISAHDQSALVDAEGRAFGITRHFGLTNAEEAASLVSVLRLAALRGSLMGADFRILGQLLLALGPGSVALAAGLPEMPPAASLDAFRAREVKAALSGAEYKVEESA
jgi:protein-arginine kinase/protein-arginine kinase activator protein McsA